MEPTKQPAPSLLTLPSAIVIAGAIIAVAIIWSTIPKSAPVNNQIEEEPAAPKIAEVTASDHILGNPNAKIKIVEYSDTSCPFCKMFHPTMQKIMDEYGPGGDVAWVYRHFPIDQPGTRSDGGTLHPNAGHEAQALECAAVVGGNTKFWEYTNRLYEVTPAVTPQTPAGLDQKELYNIAKFVGLDVAAFTTCLDSGQTKAAVQADYLDGVNAGIQGTPFSMIITPKGEQVPVVGAQEYKTIKGAIDTLLADVKVN